MFTIGEFSRITGLSVKAIRLYHKRGLMEPSFVHDRTGYRYYTEADVERARAIVQLRQFEVSLAEIEELLREYSETTEDGDLLDFLATHRKRISDRMEEFRSITTALDLIIEKEKEYKNMKNTNTDEVVEKQIEPMLIAGVRMKGKYHEVGKGFKLLGRRAGRHIAGKALTLYYDGEYREDDADFEACFPVKKPVEAEGIECRELEGGRAVTLLHRGPYEELGRSYERILAYIREHDMEFKIPTREVCIKGPGMIFKGNPKNYLTEIQMLVKE